MKPVRAIVTTDILIEAARSADLDFTELSLKGQGSLIYRSMDRFNLSLRAEQMHEYQHDIIDNFRNELWSKIVELNINKSSFLGEV